MTCVYHPATGWRLCAATAPASIPSGSTGSGAWVRGKGTFRDYDLGLIHIDIKHLPKLQTADGERRKRYLFVAIDRRSRSVHLAVKSSETERNAIAGLRRSKQCLKPCARQPRPSRSASPMC